MKKIAFVVQRYGLEVNGGAELECRQFAEKLKDIFDVTILTTRAIDYFSWKNEYKLGEEFINGVRVKRFSVDEERNMQNFHETTHLAFNKIKDCALGEKWMKEQGPFSSTLFNHIRDNQNDYSCFVFFTYLYATTYFGLPLIDGPKKILFPEAHDEQPIYMKIFDRVFRDLDGIIYNTEEERAFVEYRFNVAGIPCLVAGMGVELPQNESIAPNNFKKKYGLDDYILYAGRIEQAKGCQELFDNFLRYKEETHSKLKLVLIGKVMMDIPRCDSIISLGFVSEKDKFEGIMDSEFVVIPSKHESLSIILLESFLCKKTVLVNGGSDVLKAHCVKSNGGLWYDNESDFLEAFSRLHTDYSLRTNLGKNGYDYVRNKYDWKLIVPQVEEFLMS